MKLPKMIGAHTPKKPSRCRPRIGLTNTAKDFNRAYDDRFCATRPHMTWLQTGPQGER